MLPIDPAELSALLDGELSQSRADEVRAALAADATLREAYERLVALDADCQAKAAAALFQPRVQFSPDAFPARYLVFAGVIGLLLLRLALKASPPLVAAGAAALLLAVLLGWGLQHIIRATDADWRRSALLGAAGWLLILRLACVLG